MGLQNTIPTTGAMNSRAITQGPKLLSQRKGQKNFPHKRHYIQAYPFCYVRMVKNCDEYNRPASWSNEEIVLVYEAFFMAS